MDAPIESASIERCAVHEDAHATGTCTRCGNFVCPLCIDRSSALPDLCQACRTKAGAQKIAWERAGESWLRRYATTAYGVLVRPSTTFGRAEPGSIGASFGFAVLTAVIVAAWQVAVRSVALGVELADGADLGSVALFTVATGAGCALPLFSFAQLGAILLWALAYHLGVLTAHGRGRLAVSVWSTGYLSAIALAWIPASFLQLVPEVGTVLSLVALLAMVVWFAMRLTYVGQRYHELSLGRAAFAAWFPVLVFVVVGALCAMGVIAAAVRSRQV